MRIAVIQMAPGDDLDANIAQARTLVSAAVREGQAELVVLPEVWSCLGGTVDVKRRTAERLPSGRRGGGPTYTALQDWARSHRIWVHGGSIGELIEGAGGRLANTTLVFGPDGTEHARYRKIHLFDVDMPNGEGYRESALYVPGESIETVDVDGVQAGLAICYDLRFAELFLALRRRDVSVIFLPAAFTQQTGEAHWEILVRARAIEAQAWVVACGTTGWHRDATGKRRQTYGHSMIVSPWGDVVLRLGSEKGWGVADVDFSAVGAVRERMPVHANRRLL